MKRAPTATKRQRRSIALTERETAAFAMAPGAKRERQLAEITRAKVAIMLRTKR